jgi:hypothetical protein
LSDVGLRAPFPIREYRPATNSPTDAGVPRASSAIRNMCSRRDERDAPEPAFFSDTAFSDLGKETRKRRQPALLRERVGQRIAVTD